MTALEPIAGPSVWHGGELMQRDDWIVTLDAAEIAELETAARAALDRKLTALTRDDLPLPRLDARLRDMRDAVVEGCGFALMRGLPVDEWPREVAARAFWAIGARIGMPVCQNPLGHLLGHVKDLGIDAWAPDRRGYQSSAELPFHTDIGAEIVGLFCLRTAKAGGLSPDAAGLAVESVPGGAPSEQAARRTGNTAMRTRRRAMIISGEWRVCNRHPGRRRTREKIRQEGISRRVVLRGAKGGAGEASKLSVPLSPILRLI